LSHINSIRNRIKGHRRVRAGDLVPHELNPRQHNDAQRDALRAVYADVGFARSLLAFELPDGRLKLIDGHLRRDLDPDLEVDVEILDVSDAEARVLLLSLDPLATLADYDLAALDRLRDQTPTESDALANLWASIAQANDNTDEVLEEANNNTRSERDVLEQFLILVECNGEEQQVELLRRFQDEGLKCKPLLS
jgi:hypothetical protein